MESETLSAESYTKLKDNYVDNTEGIRQTKRSMDILADVLKLVKLKEMFNANDPILMTTGAYTSFAAEFMETMVVDNSSLSIPHDQDPFYFYCQKECPFLYSKYTDIFNRFYRQEMDLNLMIEAIKVLSKIEDGELNQEEGSVLMGQKFHDLFVDSTIKQGEKADIAHDNNAPKLITGKQISYSEYKRKKIEVANLLKNRHT